MSASSISAAAASAAAAIATSSSTAGAAAGMGRRPALRIEAVSLAFGGLQVLDGVSFAAQPGELFALIGPNGAGKTSVLNCVCGIYRARSGRIEFDERDITRESPHRIARMGIARRSEEHTS